MVNISITRTNNLFYEQRGAWHGPRESLRRGTQYNWLIQEVLCTMESCLEKEHQSPWTHPFIVGGWLNGVLPDDVCGVITSSVPPAGNLEWHVWHHIKDNACLQSANWWSPACNSKATHWCWPYPRPLALTMSSLRNPSAERLRDNL